MALNGCGYSFFWSTYFRRHNFKQRMVAMISLTIEAKVQLCRRHNIIIEYISLMEILNTENCRPLFSQKIQNFLNSQCNPQLFLQTLMRKVESRFESSIFMQDVVEQIIKELKDTIIQIERLNRNLCDELKSLNLEKYAKHFQNIRSAQAFFIQFTFSKLKHLSQKYNLIKNKDVYKPQQKVYCSICTKQLKQVKIQQVYNSLRTTNALADVKRVEIQQDQDDWEVNQFDVIMNQIEKTKKQLLTLNNQKTIYSLQEFLQSTSSAVQMFFQDKSNYQKTQNNPEVVAVLFKQFIGKFMEVSHNDIKPTVLKCAEDLAKYLYNSRKDKIKYESIEIQTIVPYPLANKAILRNNETSKNSKLKENKDQMKKSNQMLLQQKVKIYKLEQQNSQLEEQLKNMSNTQKMLSSVKVLNDQQPSHSKQNNKAEESLKEDGKKVQFQNTKIQSLKVQQARRVTMLRSQSKSHSKADLLRRSIQSKKSQIIDPSNISHKSNRSNLSNQPQNRYEQYQQQYQEQESQGEQRSSIKEMTSQDINFYTAENQCQTSFNFVDVQVQTQLDYFLEQQKGQTSQTLQHKQRYASQMSENIKVLQYQRKNQTSKLGYNKRSSLNVNNNKNNAQNNSNLHKTSNNYKSFNNTHNDNNSNSNSNSNKNRNRNRNGNHYNNSNGYNDENGYNDDNDNDNGDFSRNNTKDCANQSMEVDDGEQNQRMEMDDYKSSSNFENSNSRQSKNNPDGIKNMNLTNNPNNSRNHNSKNNLSAKNYSINHVINTSINNKHTNNKDTNNKPNSKLKNNKQINYNHDKNQLTDNPSQNEKLVPVPDTKNNTLKTQLIKMITIMNETKLKQMEEIYLVPSNQRINRPILLNRESTSTKNSKLSAQYKNPTLSSIRIDNNSQEKEILMFREEDLEQQSGLNVSKNRGIHMLTDAEVFGFAEDKLRSKNNHNVFRQKQNSHSKPKIGYLRAKNQSIERVYNKTFMQKYNQRQGSSYLQRFATDSVKVARQIQEYFNKQDLITYFGSLQAAYQFEANPSVRHKLVIKNKKKLQLVVLNAYKDVENIKKANHMVYNKIKGFFKFPYQSVMNQFEGPTTQSSINFSSFTNLLYYVLNIHQGCARMKKMSHCCHFQDLLQRIKYGLHKTQINLPKLQQNSQ